MKVCFAVLPLAAICVVSAAQQANLPATSADSQQQPASLATVLHDSAAPPAAAASLATVSTEGVSLSGPLSVSDGLAFIGNNGAITAGDKTVRLALTRGGSLHICATTQVHLSTDSAVSGGGLMIALNRGAFEGHYLPGKYSDVILTPDLRILISGPGTADFSLRVNDRGDTCFDNHGDHAPYVLATNLFEGGAYRVQPNQRVLFEHGSLQQVVDNEPESCGCPAPAPTPEPTAIAHAGAPGLTLHSGNQSNTPPAPGPSATAAQNPFPLAESEGLAPPSVIPSKPVVPAGQAHAEVTAPLAYNGEAAPPTKPPAPAAAHPSAPAKRAASNPACDNPLFPGVVCDSGSSAKSGVPTSATAPEAAKTKKRSRFDRFFRRIFGRH